MSRECVGCGLGESDAHESSARSARPGQGIIDNRCLRSMTVGQALRVAYCMHPSPCPQLVSAVKVEVERKSFIQVLPQLHCTRDLVLVCAMR